MNTFHLFYYFHIQNKEWKILHWKFYGNHKDNILLNLISSFFVYFRHLLQNNLL